MQRTKKRGGSTAASDFILSRNSQPALYSNEDSCGIAAVRTHLRPLILVLHFRRTPLPAYDHNGRPIYFSATIDLETYRCIPTRPSVKPHPSWPGIVGHMNGIDKAHCVGREGHHDGVRAIPLAEEAHSFQQ